MTGNEKSAQSQVVVFAKPPVAGSVKTRLAKIIGQHSAAKVAEELLIHTFSALHDALMLAPIWAVTEPPTASLWKRLGSPRLVQQGGGDLGIRMCRVLHAELRVLKQSQGSSASVIALGSDTPGIQKTNMRDVSSQLQQYDSVIGPADDGGFYLLGFSRISCGLLDGLAWSTPNTRKKTIEQLNGHGYSVSTALPNLFDIDTAEDLQRYLKIPCLNLSKKELLLQRRLLSLIF